VVGGLRLRAGRRWRASAYQPVVAQPALRRLLPAFATIALGVAAAAILAARVSTSRFRAGP
jgi:hypothetical protein